MAFDHGDIATLALLDCSAASTLRITASYFASSASRSAWVIQLYSGSHLTRYRLGLSAYYSAFDTVAVTRQSEYKAVNYGVPHHRDRSSDHSSLSSTQLNYARWSLLIICTHTNTLTMYTHVAGDHQHNQSSTRTTVALRSRGLPMDAKSSIAAEHE